MKQFCLNAIEQLDKCHPRDWASLFVNLKMEFFRKYQRGLICSTSHGIDWFHNIIDCLNGKEWSVEDHKGEFENNFRKLIQFYINE